jgi:hypothetical protein
MSPFAPLLGERITKVFVSDDQSKLMLFTGYVGDREQHAVVVDTYGDCCSETWFADIVGLHNILKQHVTGIELLELPEPEDGRSRQEEDQQYGVKLRSERGSCDIIYRNSSNGYYGGEAVAYRGDPNTENWVEITEDVWQA